MDYKQAAQELRRACRAKDVARVRRLFETTTQLGIADATRNLEDASPDIPTMRCLVEHGADPKVYESIEFVGSIEVLKLLAEFGYDIKSQGHLILQDFADSRETLDWLLDQGVDIDRTDHSRLDDGFRLAKGMSDDSLKVLNNVTSRGDILLFDHLVSRGADLQRSTALHCASKCHDADKATAMISHLLDMHHMDIELDNEALRDFFHASADSGSPLNCAIYYQNLPAVNELLKRGADPHGLRSSIGPLHLAIGDLLFEDGYLPALASLLEAGVELNRELDYAIQHNRMEAVKICLERGGDPASALKREETRIANAMAQEDYESDEDEWMGDEMRKLLQTWGSDKEKLALAGR